MKKLVGGGALGFLAILVVAAIALATPSSNFSTEQLSVGRFGKIKIKTHDLKLKTKHDSDVYVVRNTVQPGGQSGWHYHPGPSLITVVQGTATFYDGDDPTCTGTSSAWARGSSTTRSTPITSTCCATTARAS